MILLYFLPLNKLKQVTGQPLCSEYLSMRSACTLACSCDTVGMKPSKSNLHCQYIPNYLDITSPAPLQHNPLWFSHIIHFWSHIFILYTLFPDLLPSQLRQGKFTLIELSILMCLTRTPFTAFLLGKSFINMNQYRCFKNIRCLIMAVHVSATLWDKDGRRRDD